MQLPAAFVARMKAQLNEESDAFFAALETISPVSIRLHHDKGKSGFPTDDPVPWCDTGYYVDTRPAFHLDPHWHAGAYYVQEASSMVLDEVLRQHIVNDTPKVWLDMCAAPGGKTGILAKHMTTRDALVANEVVSQRRSVLYENLIKGGYLHTCITGIQPNQFPAAFADVILIDAPCAGEGMMRKDEEAIKQWTPQLVSSCALLQKNILDAAIQTLRPGGFLIYSTCSYSMDENIRNVAHCLRDTSIENPVCSFPDSWGIQTIVADGATGYQLYPHRVKGEGLFIAVLRKRSTSPSHEPKQKLRTTAATTNLQEWLGTETRWLQVQHEHLITLLHPEAVDAMARVLHELARAHFFPVAEIKGRDVIPQHFLAMSTTMQMSSAIALDKAAALDYLERKIPMVDETLPNGWHVVTFDGSRLGWLKKYAGGLKNHYPMEWRLRKRL